MGCETSRHARRKVLTIRRLQEMLEVRLIESASPDSRDNDAVEKAVFPLFGKE